MSRIDSWAKDKPPHISLIAQRLVFTTETGFKILMALRNNKFKFLHDNIGTPPARKWLLFYRQHRPIYSWVISRIKNAGGVASLTGNFLEYLQNNDPDNSFFQSGLSPYSESLKESYQANLDDIQLELHGTSTDFEIPPEVAASFEEPELLFLLTVFVPCAFLYGEHPTSLYRKARLGNYEAIEKLLRLDKAVLADSRIAGHFHTLNITDEQNRFDSLVSALQGGISGRIDRQKVKFKMAGFVSILSEILGQKLTAKDIKDLFDAVAIDRGQGDLIDPDLPDSPEAFIKAVQRERLFWKKAFQGGQ